MIRIIPYFHSTSSSLPQPSSALSCHSEHLYMTHSAFKIQLSSSYPLQKYRG